MFKHFFFPIGSGPYSRTDSETGVFTYLEQYFAGNETKILFFFAYVCVCVGGSDLLVEIFKLWVY